MALWNSGQRESEWYRSQHPRLKARIAALDNRDRALRSRYGARWPTSELRAFQDEARAIDRDVDELQAQQFEPWFSDSLLDALNQWIDLDEPGLADDLWKAVCTLVATRDDAERGNPALNGDQRTKLERLERLVYETLKACGPDVAVTQRLIGNWAEAGYLHGLTLTELADALGTLASDISTRLSSAPRLAPKRPPRDALRTFCLDVVVALTSHGEEIRVGRKSSAVEVARLLLQAAAFRVPDKLHVYMSEAKRRMPAALRERRARAREWARHFPNVFGKTPIGPKSPRE